MIRICIAFCLACCMVCLTALAGVGASGQEKKAVQEGPPVNADKQANPADKKETEKQPAEKMTGVPRIVKAPLPQANQDKLALPDKAQAEKKAGDPKAAKAAVRAAPLQPAPVVKAKAVPRRAVPAQVMQPVALDANFFEQQFLPQFKSIHKAELHFMRVVCQPTRQQFEKVAADSEPALRALAKRFGSQNQNGMVIVNAGRAGLESEDQTDANRQITELVSKTVRSTLSTEQADRYDKEVAERMEAANRVVVRGFVTKMDRLLHLNTEQREAMLKLLSSKWKYSASRARLLTIGEQYYPSMPDSEINPILSEAQRRVWSSVQKGNISFGVQLEVPAQADFEEVWDEPVNKAAPSGKADGKQSGPQKKERR
jgi:hypothetical protein